MRSVGWSVGRVGWLAGWLWLVVVWGWLLRGRKSSPTTAPFVRLLASFLFIHYQPRCVCMHACVRACVHRQRWCGPVNNNNRLAFNLLLPKKIKTHVRAPKRDLIRALCCCLASCFGLLSLYIYIYDIYHYYIEREPVKVAMMAQRGCVRVQRGHAPPS
jgi:hypothetical protein